MEKILFKRIKEQVFIIYIKNFNKRQKSFKVPYIVMNLFLRIRRVFL